MGVPSSYFSPKWLFVIVAFAFIVFMVVMMAVIRRSSGPAMPSDTDARERKTIEAAYALKARMRNPDSIVFERAATNSDGSLVCFVYRAQNGFGGMNRELAYALDDRLHTGVDSNEYIRVCAPATFDESAFATVVAK